MIVQLKVCHGSLKRVCHGPLKKAYLLCHIMNYLHQVLYNICSSCMGSYLGLNEIQHPHSLVG